MLKTINIPFNGDLYEIVCDVLGEVVQITVYRDNRNSVAEPLDKENLPPEVYEKLTKKQAMWWKDL